MFPFPHPWLWGGKKASHSNGGFPFFFSFGSATIGWSLDETAVNQSIPTQIQCQKQRLSTVCSDLTTQGSKASQASLRNSDAPTFHAYSRRGFLQGYICPERKRKKGLGCAKQPLDLAYRILRSEIEGIRRLATSSSHPTPHRRLRASPLLFCFHEKGPVGTCRDCHSQTPQSLSVHVPTSSRPPIGSSRESARRPPLWQITFSGCTGCVAWARRD